MTGDTHITTIENWVNQCLEDDIFLVSIKIKPTNNIKVFLDADSGLSIEKCIKINRRMYKLIEESGYYPEGDFSLEVSSPGIGEPLKLTRQYRKNIGRSLELTLAEGKTESGKLMAVTDEGVTLEKTTGKGKKAVTTTIDISFDAIKQAKVLIQF